MIETASPLTLSLAKAMGVYMIAGGLSGVLLGRERWEKILDEFYGNPAITYIAGVFVFALGAAIIMAHNIWTDPLSGFISLVAWVAAIEGAIIIAYPDPLLDWAKSMAKPAFIRVFAILTIMIGVALVLAGFTGTVGV